MTRNSKYTKEFKDSTIQLVMKGEQSVLKIGVDLGVNPKTIHNWVCEYKKLIIFLLFQRLMGRKI